MDEVGLVFLVLLHLDFLAAQMKSHFPQFSAQYSSSLLDADVLLSADVIKAKFKLEDVVLSEGLCQPVGQRSQCRDLNQAAYDLAMSVASEEAVQRLLNKV